MNDIRLLVIEDDKGLAEALEDTLLLAGYQCHIAHSAEEGIVALKNNTFAMVISDVNLPGIDGYGVLNHVIEHYPDLPIMLMTAYGDIAHAVEAMRNGAVDYLLKPFKEQELLEVVRKYTAQVVAAKDQAPIAVDPASKGLLELAARVAATDSTVLICGESGTGKEVLARYIHSCSGRSSEPFVAINCAAIPENMLEAILFGYEKAQFDNSLFKSNNRFAWQVSVLWNPIQRLKLNFISGSEIKNSNKIEKSVNYANYYGVKLDYDFTDRFLLHISSKLMDDEFVGLENLTKEDHISASMRLQYRWRHWLNAFVQYSYDNFDSTIIKDNYDLRMASFGFVVTF